MLSVTFRLVASAGKGKVTFIGDVKLPEIPQEGELIRLISKNNKKGDRHFKVKQVIHVAGEDVIEIVVVAAQPLYLNN